nr:hypothetical protein [Tanacetum cinerariifolium]
EANVPSAFKKNDVPKKTRSLTVADNIVEERIAVELPKSLRKKCKVHVVEDPDAQLLLDLCKGSKARKLESLKSAKEAVAG